MRVYLLGRFDQLGDKARVLAISKIITRMGHECYMDIEGLFSTSNPQLGKVVWVAILYITSAHPYSGRACSRALVPMIPVER